MIVIQPHALLVHNRHSDGNLVRSIRECRDFYQTQTNLLCMWCKHSIEGIPLPLPLKTRHVWTSDLRGLRKAKGKESQESEEEGEDDVGVMRTTRTTHGLTSAQRELFVVSGQFCTPACMLAYAHEKNLVVIAERMLRVVYGLSSRVKGTTKIRVLKRAPHFSHLKAFGGTLDIETFRSFGERGVDFVPIDMPFVAGMEGSVLFEGVTCKNDQDMMKVINSVLESNRRTQRNQGRQQQNQTQAKSKSRQANPRSTIAKPTPLRTLPNNGIRLSNRTIREAYAKQRIADSCRRREENEKEAEKTKKRQRTPNENESDGKENKKKARGATISKSSSSSSSSSIDGVAPKSIQEQILETQKRVKEQELAFEKLGIVSSKLKRKASQQKLQIAEEPDKGESEPHAPSLASLTRHEKHNKTLMDFLTKKLPQSKS